MSASHPYLYSTTCQRATRVSCAAAGNLLGTGMSLVLGKGSRLEVWRLGEEVTLFSARARRGRPPALTLLGRAWSPAWSCPSWVP